jgi:hypothetical protein
VGLYIISFFPLAKLAISSITQVCSGSYKTSAEIAPKNGKMKIGWFILTVYSLTALFVQWFKAKNRLTAIPHPCCALDLDPCNFLYPKIKSKPKGRDVIMFFRFRYLI